MPNKILFGEEARDKLVKGLTKVADAVGSTLGPKASNVAIAKPYDNVNVTHDGVTVAKNIILEDPFEDVGAQMIREAASKTNDTAGDGTTTSTVLAKAIIDEGLKVIRNGTNAQVLKTSIEKAGKLVLEELKKMAKPVQTDEEALQVATISAASPELGKIVADAIKKAGKDGVVSLNEVPAPDISIEHTKGLEIDRGFISAYFITNERNQANIASPAVFLTDRTITQASEILPLFELLERQKQRDVFIIADDVQAEALAFLVVNKLKGAFNIVAIKAPSFGMRRQQMLEDIAVLTGATVLSEATGRPVNSVTEEDLGGCERIESDKERTLIVNGKGNINLINDRIKLIKNELETAENEFDKDIIKQRVAKLVSGVVVINVGGYTEVERKQRQYRVEDAVNATQAAIEEGIVPGGETALFKASEKLIGKNNEIGANVLYAALRVPFLKLIENAGITDGELIAKGLKCKGNEGIDVMTEQIVDLVEKGIIDPVKVSRNVLTNAISVACEALTTDCLIVEGEKKNEG